MGHVALWQVRHAFNYFFFVFQVCQEIAVATPLELPMSEAPPEMFMTSLLAALSRQKEESDMRMTALVYTCTCVHTFPHTQSDVYGVSFSSTFPPKRGVWYAYDCLRVHMYICVNFYSHIRWSLWRLAALSRQTEESDMRMTALVFTCTYVYTFTHTHIDGFVSLSRTFPPKWGVWYAYDCPVIHMSMCVYIQSNTHGFLWRLSERHFRSKKRILKCLLWCTYVRVCIHIHTHMAYESLAGAGGVVGECVCECVCVCVANSCDYFDFTHANSYDYFEFTHMKLSDGVATISRLPKNIGLFCKRVS